MAEGLARLVELEKADLLEQHARQLRINATMSTDLDEQIKYNKIAEEAESTAKHIRKYHP